MKMITICQMEKEDADEVFRMMKVFYQSPALLHKASDTVLKRNIENCINQNCYVEGYVFKEQEKIAGYSMVAKSYSTEFGGECIWIEDLYMKPEYRGKGIGTKFFQYLEEVYKDKVVRFRLEVEKNNQSAIAAYKKNGYQELAYVQMTKEF